MHSKSVMQSEKVVVIQEACTEKEPGLLSKEKKTSIEKREKKNVKLCPEKKTQKNRRPIQLIFIVVIMAKLKRWNTRRLLVILGGVTLILRGAVANTVSVCEW
jgi:hypothetical protein